MLAVIAFLLAPAVPATPPPPAPTTTTTVVAPTRPAPTPVPLPVPVTTTPTTAAPVTACAVTWTLNSPYGFGNADGSQAPIGTTGTWSVACGAVSATEAQFPPDTTFTVAQDGGPTQ